MSAEHVAQMNELLLHAPAVRSACAGLGKPRTMSYRLADGPDGETVHWTVRFAETVQFSLAEAPVPDVCFVGDWKQMIRATGAGGDGPPEGSVEGDTAVLEELGPVLEIARAVATVPVEFPSV